MFDRIFFQILKSLFGQATTEGLLNAGDFEKQQLAADLEVQWFLGHEFAVSEGKKMAAPYENIVDLDFAILTTRVGR